MGTASHVARRTGSVAVSITLLVTVGLSSPGHAVTGIDWSTYGFDAQRTGYNPAETTIGTDNAGTLHKLWSVDLGDVMIAQAVEAAGVDLPGGLTDLVYVGTEHGDFYALDTDTGAVMWHRNLGSVSTGCSDMPDDVFGIGGAGAIDRSANIVYVAGGDGKVHAMNLSNGHEAAGWPVKGVFDRSQEHVYGGINVNFDTEQLYVVVASHCDFAPYHGKVVDIDIPTHAKVATFFPAGKHVDGGGVWGPGGVSLDPTNGHVFAATGNALTSPESFRYSEDVVKLDGSLSVLGANYPGLTGGDVDFGATPILYQRPGCPAQVAAKNKSGVLVVYSRGDVSGGYTQRLQVANVGDWEFNGIPAFSPVTNMLYIGNSSDSDQGTYFHGMVALKVGADCSLSLAWQKTVGPNYASVSPPTVANGVVYYGDGPGNKLRAFDAQTGKKLWTSGRAVHGPILAAPTVVNGRIFVGAWDNRFYAFGP